MSGPARWLHVFATLGAGGPQVRAMQLLRHLGPGIEHVLVAMDGCTDVLAQAPAGVPVRVLQAPARGGVLANVKALQALLAAERPDLVLTYNWGAIEAAWAARRLRLPLVHHEDGFLPDEAQRRHPRRSWLRWWVLKGAPVVVPSAVLQGIAVREWGLRARDVHHLVNGVDLARFVPRGSGEVAVRERGSGGGAQATRVQPSAMAGDAASAPSAAEPNATPASSVGGRQGEPPQPTDASAATSRIAPPSTGAGSLAGNPQSAGDSASASRSAPASSEAGRRSGRPCPEASGPTPPSTGAGSPAEHAQFATATARPLVIGTVGGLRPEKDHATLLAAFAQCPATTQLQVVGGGPLADDLRAQAARLGVAERVQFVGPVADTAPCYAQFDVFALSSRTEQLPLVLLEAMACGLPVVATDVGDVRATLPFECGPCVAPAGDVDALASALKLLLGNAGLRTLLGQKCRAVVSERYAASVCLQRFADLYRATAATET
jgi:glycosyltransferase involved in cell wall biosynthesis